MKLYAKMNGTSDVIDLDVEYCQASRDYVGHTRSCEMNEALDTKFWKALEAQYPELFNPQDDWYYGRDINMVANAH